MESKYFLGRTFEGNLIYAHGVRCMDNGCVVIEFKPDESFLCNYIQKLLMRACVSREGSYYTVTERFIEYWNREIISGPQKWPVGIVSRPDIKEGVLIHAELLSLNVRDEKVLVWIPNEQDLPIDKFTMYGKFVCEPECPIDTRVYEIPVRLLQEWSACVNGEDHETPYEEPAVVAKELVGSWADYAKHLSDILCKDIDLYQQKCLKYAKYPESARIIYPTLGLTGEAGEVSDKVKKVIRDNEGNFTDEIKKEIMKELGDVLWYCATLSHDLGFSLSDVAFGNIEKLESRFQRNKIGGSGDNR